MRIGDLKHAPDEYAMRLAQGRTDSHRTRDVYFNWFQEEHMSLAEKAKAKAAALRAAKKSGNKTVAAKSSKTDKKVSAKKEKSTRVQIKDAKGKVVTGRDNSFVCPECKAEITGPWSYKQHLVKQHNYTRKQAGLREAA